MSAKMTIHGRVSRAISFYNSQNVFVGIARTTPWPNESNPPDPTGNETAPLNETVAYKKISSMKLIKPNPVGPLVYRGKRWEEVDEEDAYTEGARWVLVQAVLAYDEVPIVTYRQAGVFVDLQPSAGNESKDVLLPDEIDSPGRLEVLENRGPQTRNESKKETLTFIVEF